MISRKCVRKCEPTWITCTGETTVINPVVASKGKFAKASEHSFVQSKVKNLGIPWNQPEERTRLFRSRRAGFGKNGEWKDTEQNHSNTPIRLLIQQRLQNRGLDRHASSTSAPPTPQRPVPVENGTQEVQPGFTLGRTRASWQKICCRAIALKECMEITKGWNPNR
ncbi:hypothetical protein O181_093260 [Austropuccinia psidii MF-1]|uniref:Uncharacterized protein n=1 Tax=Austropuccinia psidii MF-1 TaxID=1389203 RepID=A0A9Q3IZZ7_9BASI|nr:hypothetical protein [Austropuccinia psidii MF-1]